MSTLDIIYVFDTEIKRLETIRLYLGLQLEDVEEELHEVKVARLRQFKKGPPTNTRGEK